MSRFSVLDEDYTRRGTSRGDDRGARPKTKETNTRKPHQMNYAKERIAKEQTVKSDRFFPNGANSISTGTTFFRARGRPRPAPTPVPAPPKPRGRSASPQRRSASPVETARLWTGEHAEDIEPIAPSQRYAALASTPDSIEFGVISLREKRKEETKRDIPPPAKRRPLAQETKDYLLPVGATACNDLDSAAKEQAHKLMEHESIPALRDAIENVLENFPTLPSYPPSVLFMRMVLAHLPTDTLLGLRSLSGHRVSPTGHLWAELLGGDVINSAALRELLHQRRSLLTSFLAAKHPEATPKQRLEPATLLATAPLTVYNTTTGDLNGAFRVTRLSADEKAHPSLMRISNKFVGEIRRDNGRRSAVPNLELFQIAVDVFTCGMLRKLDWSHACVVGSTALACMLPLPRSILLSFVLYRRLQRTVGKFALPTDVRNIISSYANLRGDLCTRLKEWFFGNASPWRGSDVDLFVLAPSVEEGKARIEQCYQKIISTLPRDAEHAVVRTPNSLTIVSGTNRRNVQLLLGVGYSPLDFTLYSDLDATAMAYTGETVLALPRAVHAINTRTNFIAPSALQSVPYRSRIIKYAHRGFDAVVFELCKHWPRCDMDLDATGRQMMDQIAQRAKRVSSASFVNGVRLLPLQFALNSADFDPSQSVGVGYDDAHLPSNQTVKRAIDFAVEEGLGVSEPAFAPMPLAPMLVDSYVLVDGSGSKLKPVRQRLHDILASHRSDEFVLKCYQCNKRTPYDPGNLELSGLGLCSDCNSLNVSKISQWDNISCPERIAIVTGGRVKIGYQICLRLLRSGFTVVALTRFPNDAARRYSAEADFVTWRDRLHVYGVDLRHLPSVHAFIDAIKKRFKRLDVLINNAAQTIRRPRAYYRPLVDFEQRACGGLLPAAAEWHPLLANPPALLVAGAAKLPALPSASLGGFLEVAASSNVLIPAFAASAPLSAALTQVPLLPCDLPERDEVNFPMDKFDEHGEPADLRDETSWTTKLEDLSPIEALETQIVNSTVPLMLMQSFLPLLTSSARGTSSSFVVNVSSAEGQFDSSVKKEGTHVHTNMAKAALNMMVRTLSEEMAKQRVYLSAVDTGWVTRMRPAVKSKWKRPTAAPLSDKDGAARVLDPIARGIAGLGASHGVLLRNYQAVPW